MRYKWLYELGKAHAAGALGHATEPALMERYSIGTHKARLVACLVADRPSGRLTPEHEEAWRAGLAAGETDEPEAAETWTAPAPDPEPIEELLARRLSLQERDHEIKAAAHTRTVHLPDARPFGVFIFGDPHLDDDGCDLSLLTRHVDLVRETPGMLAACVGDVTNNWVGKLERLHGHQRTRADEAKRLAAWYLDALRDKWVSVVLGNHDLWNDGASWIHSVLPPTEYPVAADELLTHVKAPGCAPYTLHARHDFKGGSQWATTHGPAKAAQFSAPGSDVYFCGHRHVWGSRQEPTPHRLGYTAMRLGSYKLHDTYATRIGYTSGVPGGEACVLIVRPEKPKHCPSRTMVCWDVADGARFLRSIRNE